MSTETIPLNAWTHIGLRYDVTDGQGRVRFFINGQEATYGVEAFLTTTTQLAGQGARTYVGNRGQGDHAFDGLLAYARMTVPDDALDGWRTDLFPFEIPERHELEVWVKPLADGDCAVALLNRSDEPQQIATTAEQVGLPTAPRYLIRDLWHPPESQLTTGDISATVPGHGVAMYRIHPTGAGGRR